MKTKTNIAICLFLLFYHILLILFSPKPYESDETSYLFSGRNIIHGRYIISLEELMTQFGEAEKQGFTIGPNPLGYTALKNNLYTITRPAFYPFITGFFDRFLSYRLINAFFSILLIAFSYIYIKPILDKWLIFLLFFYLNPAVAIMYSRPLMSDFSSAICLFISFMSFCFILYWKEQHQAAKFIFLNFAFVFFTVINPLIRIPNVLLLPILIPFLSINIYRKGLRKNIVIIMLLLLCLLSFLFITFHLNNLFYEKYIWTGYHQTQNIRRAAYPFAFMKLLSPDDVNLKGILFRNIVMLVRDFFIAYPVLLIFLLLKIEKDNKKAIYYFLLTSFLWIIFIFFQYKVPMNLHFIFILRMFLPAAGFIALIVAMNINMKDKIAIYYSLSLMVILSTISYISFLLMTGTISHPFFRLVPLLWSTL